MVADNDTGRMKIIVESAAFAKELGREKDVINLVFLFDFFDKADRNGGFNNDSGFIVCHVFLAVYLDDFFDNVFDARRVEEVFFVVVVGGGGNNDEIGVFKGGFIVGRGGEVEIFFGEEFFDVFVFDRRFAIVYHFDFFGDDVESGNGVILRE